MSAASKLERAARGFVLAIILPSAGIAPPPAAEIRAVGATFVLVTPNGERIAGKDLVGATFTLADPKGSRLLLRIDGVQADPLSLDHDVRLYRLSIRSANGTWANFCTPDAEGAAMALPIPASADAAGTRRFSLSCTSGAVAKCVRLGYKPWSKAADGTQLLDHHRACVRMIRADYCGDGRSHTRDGTKIDVYDRLGIQVAENLSTMRFEAAWSPDGAVCVARTRLPTSGGMAALSRLCPVRLAGQLGPAACTPATEALIYNRSMPL